MLSNQVKGGIFGCISAISYAMNPLCAINLYQDGINSNTVLFYRFLIGSLILGCIMLIKKTDFSITRREAAVLALLGCIFAVSSLTFFLSFHHMGAGLAATLVFAYPVFVAVLMAIFFKERLMLPSLLTIGLTMSGIGLLYEGNGSNPITPSGIAIIMLSALAYALYIIVVNRSGIVMSSVKLTFYVMLSCLCCIVLYATLTSTGSLQLLSTGREWFYAVLLGIVPTVISLVTMAMAIRYIGSTPTAIMGALEPVTAVLIGYFVFGEPLTARLIWGVGFILVSVMLIILDAQIRRALSQSKIVRRGRIILKRTHWR